MLRGACQEGKIKSVHFSLGANWGIIAVSQAEVLHVPYTR